MSHYLIARLSSCGRFGAEGRVCNHREEVIYGNYQHASDA